MDFATTDRLLQISEAEVRAHVGAEDALRSAESAFLALHSGAAVSHPVLLAPGPGPGDRWGVKAASFAPRGLYGCKVGSYWPGNAKRGIEAHGSTIVLLDASSGHVRAALSARHLTALRTAAADALSVRLLSRQEARTLAVLGAGHQAFWNVMAVAQVRDLERVAVWARSETAAEELAKRLRDAGVPATATTIQDAVASADVISTATSSDTPLFETEWVRPGTHISAMGADTKGKQELPINLVRRAALFVDVAAQSVTIGEFEAAARDGAIKQDELICLGAVLAGDHPGRLAKDQITIFDSSGSAMQDLAIAEVALDLIAKAQTQ